jgi:RNase P protein component
MGGAYVREKAPKKNQVHEVVISVKGPIDERKFAEFKAKLKELVTSVNGGIGVRGNVDKSGSLVRKKKS